MIIYKCNDTVESDKDFIDLFKLTSAEIREHIIRLNSADFLSACRYCIGTSVNNIIGVGEQIQNGGSDILYIWILCCCLQKWI